MGKEQSMELHSLHDWLLGVGAHGIGTLFVAAASAAAASIPGRVAECGRCCNKKASCSSWLLLFWRRSSLSTKRVLVSSLWDQTSLCARRAVLGAMCALYAVA
jgi:hypothetical protein